MLSFHLLSFGKKLLMAAALAAGTSHHTLQICALVALQLPFTALTCSLRPYNLSLVNGLKILSDLSVLYTLVVVYLGERQWRSRSSQSVAATKAEMDAMLGWGVLQIIGFVAIVCCNLLILLIGVSLTTLRACRKLQKSRLSRLCSWQSRRWRQVMLQLEQTRAALLAEKDAYRLYEFHCQKRISGEDALPDRHAFKSPQLIESFDLNSWNYFFYDEIIVQTFFWSRESMIQLPGENLLLYKAQ